MESKQSAVPRVGRRGRLAWFPARPRRIITPSSAGHGRYSLARESACSPFAPLTAEQPSEPPREPHDSQRQESSCGNTSRVRDHPPVLPRGDRARRQRHQEPKTSLRWRLKLFWSQQFLSGSEVVAVFNPADFGWTRCRARGWRRSRTIRSPCATSQFAFRIRQRPTRASWSW